MFYGGLNGDGFFGEEYDDNYDLSYDYRENIGPSSKSCKYCGKGGLYWNQGTDKRWRLYTSIFTHNSETLHICDKYLSNIKHREKIKRNNAIKCPTCGMIREYQNSNPYQG